MNENAIFNDQLTAFLDSNAAEAKRYGAGFASYLDVSMQCFWDLDALQGVKGLTKKTWTRFYQFAIERFEAVTHIKANTRKYSLPEFLQFVENDTVAE